jgi:2-succinyl-5-enolpyruvyl-6-hydroxy-3-cyclohexene-1-carboxylate synthase
MLRQHPPRHFWRVDPDLPAADAFQANTAIIPLEGSALLGQLANHLDERAHAPIVVQNGSNASARVESDTHFADAWASASASAAECIASAIDTAPFGELKATHNILSNLPAGSRLQVGNSMPIRLVNLLATDAEHLPVRIDANRGTSGIDGTVSTAVGAAHVSKEIVTLLVGDLGFFYDRNGLWQSPLPANLRIVLLNNHGGGIFDVIEGPNTLSAHERSAWFLTPNALSARRTAEDHGLRYWHVSDSASLDAALEDFFAAEDSPALLEIETDMATNSDAWRALQGILRTRTLEISTH